MTGADFFRIGITSPAGTSAIDVVARSQNNPDMRGNDDYCRLYLDGKKYAASYSPRPERKLSCAWRWRIR